jgi:hypothetical protein
MELTQTEIGENDEEQSEENHHNFFKSSIFSGKESTRHNTSTK